MFFTFVFAVFWGTGAGVMFAVTPFRGTNCDADPSTFPPAWQNYVSQCEIVVSIQGVAWALCELSAFRFISSYLLFAGGLMVLMLAGMIFHACEIRPRKNVSFYGA